MEFQNPKLHKIKVNCIIITREPHRHLRVSATRKLRIRAEISTCFYCSSQSKQVVTTSSNFKQVPNQSRRTFKTRQHTQPIKAPDHTSEKAPGDIPYYSTLPWKIASFWKRSNVVTNSSELLENTWNVCLCCERIRVQPLPPLWCSFCLVNDTCCTCRFSWWFKHRQLPSSFK